MTSLFILNPNPFLTTGYAQKIASNPQAHIGLSTIQAGFELTLPL